MVVWFGSFLKSECSNRLVILLGCTAGTTGTFTSSSVLTLVDGAEGNHALPNMLRALQRHGWARDGVTPRRLLGIVPTFSTCWRCSWYLEFTSMSPLYLAVVFGVWVSLRRTGCMLLLVSAHFMDRKWIHDIGYVYCVSSDAFGRISDTFNAKHVKTGHYFHESLVFGSWFLCRHRQFTEASKISTFSTCAKANSDPEVASRPALQCIFL